jgi:hypothetical protein
MLIDNIDRLYNTAGIIAVAVKSPRLGGGDDISIRGDNKDDMWGPVLRSALDLHAKAGMERVRSIIGAYTVFSQSEEGQVAAVAVVSADAFIKSVHRTIHRMGKKSREASVEKASPRQGRRDGSVAFSGSASERSGAATLGAAVDVALSVPRAPKPPPETTADSNPATTPTTAGRQRRAIQQEVADEQVAAPATSHAHEMGGLVPSREEW